MAQIKDLLQEKEVKTLEKASETNSIPSWKIASILFDNLIRKATKVNCLIEFDTTTKIIKGKHGIPRKIIKKTKIKKIRLNSNGSRFNSSLSLGALWVKPLIRNNRVVFFWKGQYIDGATIFGESINRYQ